jgi:murein DD-endopeptidase MepM/ murein hydrolase activator NlpD
LVIGILIGSGGTYLVFSAKATKTCPDSSNEAKTVSEQVPSAAPLPVAAVAKKTQNPTVEKSLKEKGLRHLDLLISGSLYKTLAKEVDGREADILSAHLSRVMTWWFDLKRDVQKSDRLKVLYQPAENPRNLRILAFEYTSAEKSKSYSAYYYTKENARYGRYYDPDGVEIEKRLVNSPVEDYEQITELMNLAGRRHRGVDFKMDEGSPIVASFKAKIMRRNWSTRRNGFCLDIKYIDSGIRALFLHLEKVDNDMKPGMTVPAGTVIAYSGNSGRSTAPHLHYELHSQRGKLLNPFEVHKTKNIKLENDDKRKFMQRYKDLDKLLTGGLGSES